MPAAEAGPRAWRAKQKDRAGPFALERLDITAITQEICADPLEWRRAGCGVCAAEIQENPLGFVGSVSGAGGARYHCPQ